MNDAAIYRFQLAALVRLVAELFAFAGLVPGGPALESMPGIVRKQVLRVLRPAEAALRRLIVVRARGLCFVFRAGRNGPARPIPGGSGTGIRAPLFALFDPRKWFAELATRRALRGPGPRILTFDDDWSAPHREGTHEPEAEPDPADLCRRLQALHIALSDIPAQARRLVRMQARRRTANAPPKRTEPMRPGWPPGYRKRHMHAIDSVLYECHVLARRAPRAADTS